MAELALDLVVAKWPHVPPNGLLFGCIVVMAIGLAIALKLPAKKPKTPKS